MKVAKLLDSIKSDNDIKNDRALAMKLGASPALISKLRSGAIKLGATMIVRLHEEFDIPVRELQLVAA